MTARNSQLSVGSAPPSSGARRPQVERRRTESALKAVMESVMAHAPHYIHLLDDNLVTTFINRIGPGYVMNDVVGQPFGQILSPADCHRVLPLLQEVLRTGQPCEYEVRAEQRTVVGWYKTSVGPIRSDGVITGLVLVTADITDQKQAHEELLREKTAVEAARMRDQALINSIGEGLLVIDEAGLIANINPSGASMLGYERDELIGKWFTSTVPAYDQEERLIEPLNRAATRALAGKQVVSTQVRYARQDGSLLPVALTVSPVVLDGRPIGAIEVFRDITREHELDRAKEEFVSLASHQLRTPASGVKAYISMLLDGYAGELTDQQRQILERAAQANERQLQVVNDMLNTARLSAGRIVPDMATVNLSTLIQEVADELSPAIQERRQHLRVQLPDSLEAVVDAKLMRMMIENLLSNASKYTPEGGRIRLQAELSADVGQCCLKISDTGVGIARQDMPKLFQRFTRIPNRLSTSRGGSGLGLYLVQTITELHEGRLRVDSRPGHGTTFEVVLPVGAGQRSSSQRKARLA